ncbi:MAG: hypothetical protein ACYDHH_02440 [Solirubrobacteraceae bacterium]
MSDTLDALARVALAEATGGRALAAKVRALCKLAQAGDRSPVDRDRLRAELQTVAGTELLSGRALEAAVRALDTLEALDAVPLHEQPQATPMTGAERLDFELNLLFVMTQALGWRFTQQEWNGNGARLRRLHREAGPILSSDDPRQALADWRRALKAAPKGTL